MTIKIEDLREMQKKLNTTNPFDPMYKTLREVYEEMYEELEFLGVDPTEDKEMEQLWLDEIIVEDDEDLFAEDFDEDDEIFDDDDIYIECGYNPYTGCYDYDC